MTTTTAAPRSALPSTRPATSGWHAVAVTAAAIVVLAGVVTQILAGEVIPPVLAFTVLTTGAAAFALAKPRPGSWALLAVALIGLALSAPFAVPSLGHPESPADFLVAVIDVPLRLVVAGAALAGLRRLGGAGAGAASLAVMMVAAVVISLVAAAGVTSDAAAAGDLAVTAAEVQWQPEDLAVSAGQAVFVDNADPLRHTFTVEGTSVDVELPAGAARRIALDLEAGRYRLLCLVPGHEAMVADLVITP